MNILLFALETSFDAASARRIHGLGGIDDAGCFRAVEMLQHNKTGKTDLPLYLLQVISLSVLKVTPQNTRLVTFSSAEKDILQRFMEGIEHYKPLIVSWNGRDDYLPVLNYRMLHCQVTAPLYWEQGENNPAFYHSNYQDKIHSRHLDLMQELSGTSSNSAHSALAEVAGLVGAPSDGRKYEKVWRSCDKGSMPEVIEKCESDLVRLYLVFLHFQKMRGALSNRDFHLKQQNMYDILKKSGALYLQVFADCFMRF